MEKPLTVDAKQKLLNDIMEYYACEANFYTGGSLSIICNKEKKTYTSIDEALHDWLPTLLKDTFDDDPAAAAQLWKDEELTLAGYDIENICKDLADHILKYITSSGRSFRFKEHYDLTVSRSEDMLCIEVFHLTSSRTVLCSSCAATKEELTSTLKNIDARLHDY